MTHFTDDDWIVLARNSADKWGDPLTDEQLLLAVDLAKAQIEDMAKHRLVVEADYETAVFYTVRAVAKQGKEMV